jgi:hypothetical protein
VGSTKFSAYIFSFILARRVSIGNAREKVTT